MAVAATRGAGVCKTCLLDKNSFRGCLACVQAYVKPSTLRRREFKYVSDYHSSSQEVKADTGPPTQGTTASTGGLDHWKRFLLLNACGDVW